MLLIFCSIPKRLQSQEDPRAGPIPERCRIPGCVCHPHRISPVPRPELRVLGWPLQSHSDGPSAGSPASQGTPPQVHPDVFHLCICLRGTSTGKEGRERRGSTAQRCINQNPDTQSPAHTHRCLHHWSRRGAGPQLAVPGARLGEEEWGQNPQTPGAGQAALQPGEPPLRPPLYGQL